MIKKIYIKLVAILLCVVMISAMLPLSVLAEMVDETDTPTQEEIVTPEDGEGGDEQKDIYANAVDVATAQELEMALEQQEMAIRIVANFMLDRTFYVTVDTAIFTEEAHTLKRDPNFGGDLFVVGEAADGTLCEEPVVLILGHSASTEKDLLIIDGDRDNMAVDVNGSVLFIVGGACVDLFENVTICNALKVGNAKTLTGNYGVSYEGRVGGAVAIVASGASMNIYGGKYFNNSVNEIVDEKTEEGMVSSQGGVIYDFGKLNVYGGEFSQNFAGRGGVFYCYRTINLYNARILNNTASNMGGAIYMPNSTSAYLYIGGENEHGDSHVLFQNNSAASFGGAIYARHVLDIQNAEFIENHSTASSGGAIAAFAMELTISNTLFDGNTAKSYGSAIYFTEENGKNSEEMTISNTKFKNNSVSASGGAIYMNLSAVASMENVEFSDNTAKNNGGAIYLNNGHIDINGGVFNKNSGGQAGGAITANNQSSVLLNDITATENSAGASGGFVHAGEGVSLVIYDSTISNNTSVTNGGAVSYIEGSFGGIYNTTFTANHSTSNGGAVNVYTNGYNTKTKVVLHSCSFTSNIADGSGGAIYASKASVIDLYNTTAKQNSAKKGGFLYHTTTNTTINLSALVLQGNTASEGGPIIWGNSTGAILNLDKGLIHDLDYEGDMDDAYWATAIVNLLKVKDAILEVPNYTGYTGALIIPELPQIPVKISSADSLEKALQDGKTLLKITQDFALDRTFYIYRNTTIYSVEQHTLTRDPNFGGDLFVVGEYSDATACEHEVTLTLGDPVSTAKDLLIIDGNRDNMTVDVNGSMLFIVDNACVDIYENVTMRNALKVGNEKTLTGSSVVSYPVRVGGAVAIVTQGASMNIYGGTFSNNAVNSVTNSSTEEGQVSSQGGVIYDYGKLNIYGGVFENNFAGRGGVLYCYRTINIYKAEFNNNSASSMGGVIYMPNSTAAFLYIGAYTPLVESGVTFKGNTSSSQGGAIYAQNRATIQNATFTENKGSSGGAIASISAIISISDSVFSNNTSTNYGGAIYANGHNSKNEETDLTISGCDFTSNSSKNRGGAIYLASNAAAQLNVCSLTKNSSATGGAVYVLGANLVITYSTVSENQTTGTGAAIAGYTDEDYTSSTIILSRVTGEKNIAGTSGGFAYCNGSVSLVAYSCTFENNISGASGGAISYDVGSFGAIYNSTFTNNTADGQGGALNVYTLGYTNGNKVLLHTCTFTNNVADGYGGAIYASKSSVVDAYNITATQNSASKGGFLYHTTTNTTVTLVGVTISGNTATDGGPIIWGNLTNAHLYLDKAKWSDLDHTGSYDSAYWKKAIVNKLTVHDHSEEIPKWLDYLEESYDHMADAVDVATPKQLEDAINSGAPHIRIIADIIIDRTYYITGNTTIFSTLSRKLTRSPNFGGDMFVVGENAEGESALLLGGNAKLILGNPLSTKENLLIIDGNKDNMTEAVKGSVVFIGYSSSVDLYTNVTVQNTHKTDNERTYNEAYLLSRPNRIGGTLAVVASGTLNIYGGIYKDNLVNDEDTSSEETRNCSIGGLIYNNSNVHIYGGVFENNQAARGGVIYSYRIVKILGGSFIGNTATVSGGVLYMPNAAPSHTYIGSESDDGAKVLFQNNSALSSHGGAIYTSPLCALVIYGNTTFDSNKTSKSGAAIYSSGQLTARNTVFSNNIANSYGGAVYAVNANGEYVTRYQNFENCTFKNNIASLGGALVVYSSNKEFANGAIAIVTDCTFTSNSAASPVSQAATGYGGAIYVERKSSLTIKGSTFTKNTARTEGGAIYAGGSSSISVEDTTFKQNSIHDKGKSGGAISIHSVTLDLTDVTFTSNVSKINGGALYISYSSSVDHNSEVSVTDCTFTSNTADSLGGAVYVTKQKVDEEKRILTILNSEFKSNKAVDGGGAMYFVSGAQTYIADVKFTKNSVTEGNGGAISTSGGILEIDTASFTGNNAANIGGAIYLTNGANVVMNAVTASGNYSEKSSGLLYSEDSSVNIYNSDISNNKSLSNNAGAIMFNQGTTANVYNTTFTNNIADGNGGALFVYTNGTPVVIQDCSLVSNQAGSGGGIYVSKASLLYLCNITATGNSATKGGFMYETTGNTQVAIAGLTVSGNTATSGGPIIWGNIATAILNIDKSQYKDNDVSGALDDAYWATAIVNKLTVNDTSLTIPTYIDYVSKKNVVIDEPSEKTPVPVQPVFDLAQKSSDENINIFFAKFPKIENSSNFMSKNVTRFDNINNGTVTVDTFAYPNSGTADNCNVGMGLLIYQALCYKKAYPNEEVYIDISSYRFSIEAAVNINRNSRYFGYMRQLGGKNEYDKYGFVRIAYLLICAAKMGIHVTAIGHQDAYPMSSNTVGLNEYFTSQLNDPCDPAYLSSGVVGDYLNFCQVDWTLQNKGGTDMMHTKLCAVSHYLDMNGVAHRNAVWTGSTNLDGITGKGINANSRLQTATIISGHEDIYRISVNYLRMIPNYQGQEEIYEFQNLVSSLSTEQGRLILAGRGDEIPADEQIIYLGSENDSVFELYFTPMGGDTLVWDETFNPYCKYLRKLYNSEDYIIFTWNAAEYNSEFALGRQIESMLIEAFHRNRNVNNKIYGRMEHFDTTSFNDLVVGVDIGFKSFNELYFGEVHNKDVQFSYVENGQRYYVNLLNSMNVHSGSMYYQSNFALVIKETDCDEDSVFFALADETTQGIVSHNYSDEVLTYIPDDLRDGYTYHPCLNCDKKIVLDVVHHPSNWIIASEATAQKNGIGYRKCLVCGAILESREHVYPGDPVEFDMSQNTGKNFTAAKDSQDSLKITGTPKTIEATIKLDKAVVDRGGVIVGNYDNSTKDQLNLEIHSYGRVRLFMINDGERIEHVFQTDIRSEKRVHIAVTIEETSVSLYLDGQLKETATLDVPNLTLSGRMQIGGDNRYGNACHFKGTIYSVHLFDHVRDESKLLRDAVAVFPGENGLMATKYFTSENKDLGTVNTVGRTFSANSSVKTDSLTSTPLTFEAIVLVPKTLEDRAGVIVGNYDGNAGPRINLEVYQNGKVRLYLHNGTTSSTVLFNADIRSDTPTHIAITIDGLTATLYINGVAAVSQKLPFELPSISGKLKIGGDYRSENTQYFKGGIYAVHLFDSVRTPEQIRNDMRLVTEDTANVMYSRYFALENQGKNANGITFTETSAQSVENLSATPHTIEAIVQLNRTCQDRGGVIVGNYDALPHGVLNLEIFTGGRIRLYASADDGTRTECTFDPNIRSDDQIHIAVTIDGLKVKLYLNGKHVQTKYLTVEVGTATDNFKIGGDNRDGNTQYFKGCISSVSLFSDIRTDEEIMADVISVNASEEGLLYTQSFSSMFVDESLEIIPSSKTFAEDYKVSVGKKLSDTPLTFEAIVQVDKNFSGRGGVIVGNYDNYSPTQMTLEIYSGGRPRLFYIIPDGTRADCIFNSDIRSDKPTHIAVTVDGLIASLYIDGVLAEQKALPFEMPEITRNFQIGGDNRYLNPQYFKGKIFSVQMFSQPRTAKQIFADYVCVNVWDQTLLYSTMFVSEGCAQNGHVESDIIVDTIVSENDCGIHHTECTVCGKLLKSWKTPNITTIVKHCVYQKDQAFIPTESATGVEVGALTGGPLTFGAVIQLGADYQQRAGVIIGNYDGSENNQINLEIYTDGKPRLYYKVNNVAYTHTFKTDIRSNNPTHIAVTIDGLTIKLYVNGALAETAQLKAEIPVVTDNFVIGGDNRQGNTQCFKGAIYSAYMFSDVRTAGEVAVDRYLAASDSDDLLFSKTFTAQD